VLSRRFAVISLVCGACGGSQYPDIDEPLPPGARQEPAAVKAPVRSPLAQGGGTLKRADVERVIDAGLGRFLANVTLEPNFTAGKFSGWQIVSLSPREHWEQVDLRPGDVVTRVNGLPIERETEAFEAFQVVRQASVLEVSYLRRGQPRLLRYTIVGAPSKALPPRREPPPPKP
jgi:hypothetical protein